MLENKSNIIIASILLFLAALFWSGNFIVGKIAGLNEIPPISLNILRWSLAFLILLPLTYKEILEKKEIILKNKTYPLIVTFNPSYLIRFPENKKFSWEDLKKINQKIQNLNIKI